MILPPAASRALKDSQVFLTGGTSPLGSGIASLLDQAGATVNALVRDRSRTAGLAGRVRLLEGNCERLEEFRDEVRASAWVIHAAGLHLAPLLIRVLAGHPGLNRVVFISSARVAYPDTALAAGELEGKSELLAREDEITASLLPWTILRPTLIFSPRDRSLSRVRRYLAARSIFPLPGSGRAVKQPISAGDLAVSVVKALVSPAANQKRYDLPGRDITVREMFETMSREMGRKVLFLPVPRLPLEALRAGCRAAGFARGSRALTRFLRWYREILVSGEAASHDFQHQPGSFAQNIRAQLSSTVSKDTPPLEREPG
jgi:NADH dehydrogenase